MPAFRLTPYDLRLAARTALLAALLGTLAGVVLVATDEATATASDRVGRLAVLTPVLGAMAIGLVRAEASRRGELAALAAVGASPARALLGPSLAAAALGVLGTVAIAVSAGSIASLFPALPRSPWHLAGGRFLASGVSFDGVAIAFSAPSPPLASVIPPRSFVAATVLATSLVLPAWTALPMASAERAVSAAVALTAAIVAFHAVAAGAPGAVLLAAPVALAIHAASRAATVLS